ncbi:MAG: transposase [Treponema sp.]|nr:transposase [Treponema sp.]
MNPGPLNFITKKFKTITNDTYITAEQVIMLIDKLAVSYTGGVINLVLDNARYQHCRRVKDYAASQRVELVFLPAYSPNLNLIERLWKFVKSEVLNVAYYGSFDEFKRSIDGCIGETDKKHRGRIDTLASSYLKISNRFQTFSHSLLNDIFMPKGVYLAFFEFRYLKKYGEMPLELEYKAWEHDPVPIEIYANRETIGYFSLTAFEPVPLKSGGTGYIVKPGGNRSRVISPYNTENYREKTIKKTRKIRMIVLMEVDHVHEEKT